MSWVGKSKFIALLLFFISCLSSISNGQWVLTNSSGITDIQNFAVIDTILFAAIGNQVARTTDYGDHWTVLKDSLMVNDISALEASGTNLFAAVPYKGVILSTDNGGSWRAMNTGLTNGVIHSLNAVDSEIFAGADDGLYMTSDTGAHWSALNNGIENRRVLCFAKVGQYDFTGIFSGGIFRSSDNGSNWESVGFPNTSVGTFVVNSANLYAGTDVGPVHSTDNGNTWDTITEGLIMVPFINAFATYNTYLFSGTDYGVFLLNNNRKWVAVNEGLTRVKIFSLAICGRYLFAGTTKGQMYRRPLTEMTDINAVGNISNNELSLSSFPNPFSQSTSIKFVSDKSAFTQVSIHNLLGSEVARLFSGSLDGGEHSFTWDAHGMPPGMYICIIRSNGSTQELPMMLVR